MQRRAIIPHVFTDDVVEHQFESLGRFLQIGDREIHWHEMEQCNAMEKVSVFVYQLCFLVLWREATSGH